MWLLFFCLVLGGCALAPYDQTRLQHSPPDWRQDHQFVFLQYPSISVWSVEPDDTLGGECRNFAQGLCWLGTPAEIKYPLQEALRSDNAFVSVHLEDFTPPLRLTVATAYFQQRNNEPGTPDSQEFVKLQLSLYWQDKLIDSWPVLMHLPNQIDLDSPMRDKMNLVAEVIADETRRVIAQGGHLTAPAQYRLLDLPNYAEQMIFPDGIGEYRYEETRYNPGAAGLFLEYLREDNRARLQMDIRPLTTAELDDPMQVLAERVQAWRDSRTAEFHSGVYQQFGLLDTETLRWFSRAGQIRGFKVESAYEALNGAAIQTRNWFITRDGYRIKVSVWAPLEENLDSFELQLREALTLMTLPPL